MSGKSRPVVALLKEEYQDVTLRLVLSDLSSSEKGAIIPLSIEHGVLYCRGHYVSSLVSGMLNIPNKFPDLQEAVFSLHYFEEATSC
jgi:hypothetical protein